MKFSDGRKSLVNLRFPTPISCPETKLFAKLIAKKIGRKTKEKMSILAAMEKKVGLFEPGEHF